MSHFPSFTPPHEPSLCCHIFFASSGRFCPVFLQMRLGGARLLGALNNNGSLTGASAPTLNFYPYALANLLYRVLCIRQGIGSVISLFFSWSLFPRYYERYRQKTHGDFMSDWCRESGTLDHAFRNTKRAAASGIIVGHLSGQLHKKSSTPDSILQHRTIFVVQCQGSPVRK